MNAEVLSKGKVLVVVDETESGRIALDKLIKLARMGLRADVYIVFVKEMEVPPMVSEKKEIEAYHRMRLKAMKLLERYINELESVGLRVRDVKVVFGKPSERVLRIEKDVEPDLIVVGVKRKSLFRRLLEGDPCRDLIEKSKTSIVICKR